MKLEAKNLSPLKTKKQQEFANQVGALEKQKEETILLQKRVTAEKLKLFGQRHRH